MLEEAHAWLNTPLVIEEKLDGSNVAIWLERGRVRVAGRGGLDAMDRAGQLGRLRAWVAERGDALGDLLREGEVLYGEWLWLQHTIAYDSLPDWLIVLDLWSPSTGFLDVEERDRRVTSLGLQVPPLVHRGEIGSLRELPARCSAARWAPVRMEGMVLRRESGGRLVERAKWVRPDFQPKPDVAWRAPFPTNRLASTSASGRS